MNDPNTWTSLDRILQAYSEQKVTFGGEAQCDGIGVVLLATNGIVAVDLDGVRTPESGELLPTAKDVVAAFDTYTEISPSGTGLRLFCYGTLPPTGRATVQPHGRKFEVYSELKYLTVTGQHLAGTPTTLNRCDEAILDFHRQYIAPEVAPYEGVSFPAAPGSPSGPVLSDPKLLELARSSKNGARFTALWDGDTSAHQGDSSGADLALCGALAFWSGKNASQMDRLFRQSGLFRLKWDDSHRGDGATYGQMTIEKAIAGCKSVYDPTYYEGIRESLQGSGVEVTSGFALDDIGNGRRFAAQHQKKARFCPAWKSWLIYDDAEGRWKRDQLGKVHSLAKTTALSIKLEALDVENEAKSIALHRHANLSVGRGKRDIMLRDAACEPEMAIDPSQFDSDVWKLNLQNGVLDLRSGALGPHASEALHSKLAPVAFDPDAKCPRFEAFLETVFEGNAVLIDCGQRLLGYCLTGDTREQVFFTMHGDGANGKSTLLKCVMELLGDYAHEIEPHTITIQRNERIAVAVADLVNVRLAVTSENAEEQRLDEGKVKKWTGGEKLTGERKFEHPFSFWPQFKLILVTNHMPEIRGQDDGIWRRLMPIPFEQLFWFPERGQKGEPELQADRGLIDKLRGEYPGILNWLIEGCGRWQREGLLWPEVVRDKKLQFRLSQDLLSGFLIDRCIKNPECQCLTSDLYEEYKNWCRDNSVEVLKPNRFGKHLSGHGFTPMRTKTRRGWTGVALKAPTGLEMLTKNTFLVVELGSKSGP